MAIWLGFSQLSVPIYSKLWNRKDIQPSSTGQDLPTPFNDFDEEKGSFDVQLPPQ